MKCITYRTNDGKYVSAITTADGSVFAASAATRRDSRKQALKDALKYEQQQPQREDARP